MADKNDFLEATGKGTLGNRRSGFLRRGLQMSGEGKPVPDAPNSTNEWSAMATTIFPYIKPQLNPEEIAARHGTPVPELVMMEWQPELNLAIYLMVDGAHKMDYLDRRQTDKWGVADQVLWDQAYANLDARFDPNKIQVTYNGDGVPIACRYASGDGYDAAGILSSRTRRSICDTLGVSDCAAVIPHADCLIAFLAVHDPKLNAVLMDLLDSETNRASHPLPFRVFRISEGEVKLVPVMKKADRSRIDLVDGLSRNNAENMDTSHVWRIGSSRLDDDAMISFIKATQRVVQQVYVLGGRPLGLHLPLEDRSFQVQHGGTPDAPVLVGAFTADGRPIMFPRDLAFPMFDRMPEFVAALFTSEQKAIALLSRLEESGCLLPAHELRLTSCDYRTKRLIERGLAVVNPLPEFFLTAFIVMELVDGAASPTTVV